MFLAVIRIALVGSAWPSAPTWLFNASGVAMALLF
jgi:hypothetical protein